MNYSKSLENAYRDGDINGFKYILENFKAKHKGPLHRIWLESTI
jgi:hypothetical protein